MPRYDIQCTNGHEREVWRTIATRRDPCPECGADVEVVWKSTHAVIGDDIPGGMWFENGLRSPQKFYSHSEHRKAVEANGCQIAPRWVENDKHLINWAAGMTAKQLEDARILLSRGKREAPPDTSLQTAKVEWVR